MTTGHSSLLADTGLSERALDRLGIVPVQRSDEPHAKLGGVGRYGTRTYQFDPDNLTLPPFADTEWYEDPDVRRYLPRPRVWWGSR